MPVAGAQPVVEMRDLTVQWGQRPVLDRVNLQMQPGERLAVVGPSGAGKSTVLRLLAGLQLPTQGELCLFGTQQTYLRLDQTRPRDVRLVFRPCLLAPTVEQTAGVCAAAGQGPGDPSAGGILSRGGWPL